jgi:transcriptional regulator GlxA family with amidase domain
MRIAILALPGVHMLDVAGPMDVFSEVNSQLNDAGAYQVEIVGRLPGSVRSLSGTSFGVDKCIRTLEGPIDTLLVAGTLEVRDYEGDQELLKWIRNQAKSVRRVGSICTGAFLLAHAGLLNGRKATTHWNSTGRLAATFPNIGVEPNQIYIKDGPIYTSAGVTASMDLALALVEEDHGHEVALKVAKALVLFLKRPGGQSQFSIRCAELIPERPVIREICGWIANNLTEDLSVETLAERVGMSTRNFARVFKRETELTPADYVEAARVEAAQRIMEERDRPLSEIASVCGFGDPKGLRRAFVRQISVTPAEYRDRFRIIDHAQ